MTGPRDGVTVDRLASPEVMVSVVHLCDASFGATAGSVREPHRHDYHELLWAYSGEGHHRIDGASVPFTAGTITLVGRGQVHVMEDARNMVGAVVQFREEMLSDCGGLGWLLHSATSRVTSVPPSEQPHLNGLIAALEAEAARPPDGATVELQRHLLSAILLLVQRWFDASQIERPEAADTAVRLHRRFAEVLERDFQRHHDAAHYADELRVPATALSRALVETTGRTTKELVTDRVMLEASRLLLFTDLTIGEIAFRTGFRDQLYFSRAFKRSRGSAPSDYRLSQRGLGAA